MDLGVKYKPINLPLYDRIWIGCSWWAVSFSILWWGMSDGPSITWNQATLGMDGVE